MTIEQKETLLRATLDVFAELKDEDKLAIVSRIKGMVDVRSLDKGLKS